MGKLWKKSISIKGRWRKYFTKTDTKEEESTPVINISIPNKYF